MCLCFKPGVLFGTVDQDRVEPSDYEAWKRLISRLVKHYKDRGTGIRYWKVANEPDIGESGGCPYRFQPDNYVRYYGHTAAAILKADPNARVGGPALANVRSPILPALLSACDEGGLPLNFISWHIYSSDPARVRGTIEYAKDLLKKHPRLKPETFLDEWNMDLQDPPLDPRFQPCYLLEVIWQMKDAGLSWSCYYHIRDYHVAYEQFASFFSPQGASFIDDPFPLPSEQSGTQSRTVPNGPIRTYRSVSAVGGGGRRGMGRPAHGVACRHLPADEQFSAGDAERGQSRSERDGPRNASRSAGRDRRGAPSRPASRPASKAPKGAIPMNIME